MLAWIMGLVEGSHKNLYFHSRLIRKNGRVRISDGPMIDYSRKSVGLGFRLRQSIVK